MKSIKNQNQVNESKVVTVVGPNKVSKDLIDVVVYDESGNAYTVGELFDELLAAKQKINELELQLNNFRKTQDNVDKTITEALDIVSLKVSQIEMSIKELERK
jgi:DNA-directed RNA polymerase specialized sigma subunit